MTKSTDVVRLRLVAFNTTAGYKHIDDMIEIDPTNLSTWLTPFRKENPDSEIDVVEITRADDELEAAVMRAEAHAS